MDTEFVKWLASLGVGGAIAAIIFSVYRKDVRALTELWRTQTELLVKVVAENTASNTRLTIMIESMHRRLDNNGLKRSHEDDR